MMTLNRLREERGFSPGSALLAFRNPLPMEAARDRVERATFAVWFFDAELGLGVRPFPGFTALLESFAAATHGSVVGYEREADERVRPMLAEGHAERMRRWGLDTARQAVRAYLEELVLDPSLLEDRVDVRQSLLELLHLFRRDPSRAEAGVWGSFPLEIGIGVAAHPRPLVRALSGPEAIRLGFRRRRGVDGSPVWLRGSLQLSGRAIRSSWRSLDAVRRRLPNRRRASAGTQR